MRVEIWTDIICPWCGIGDHRLEQALTRFGHASDVELVHRSFQLDEHAPAGETEHVREMLVKKKGLPPAQVESLTRRIEQMAKEDGLSPYVVLENRTGNTSLAHEFAAWATENGKGREVWRLLYETYFGRAQSIFSVEELAPLATQLGLEVAAAREALTSRRFAQQVLEDGREARALGCSGVPFVVIDRRYAVAGAQPIDVLVKALETAWAQRPPKPDLVAPAGEGESCGPDGCEVTRRP